MANFPSRQIKQRFKQGDESPTTKGKGDALEDIVVTVFCKVPGFSFMDRNIVNSAQSVEIDVLLFNQKSPDGLPFLPDYVFFECKNWSQPVDAGTIRDFIAKLRRSHLEFGILIATSGITGETESRNAGNEEITHAFAQDKVKLIVITRDELLKLRSSDDVIQLVRRKFSALIMGQRVI